jgi:Raf kinase inhibitor-like YbhB/YbcL family protein
MMPFQEVEYSLREMDRAFRRWSFWHKVILAVLSLWACALPAQTNGGSMSFELSSTSFAATQLIPKKFTCDGSDTSPALSWKDAPNAVRSFALIVDDPDAPVGTWTHWVLYDLPADAKELPEGLQKQEQLSNGARQGRNDFRKIGYGGPCPPAGKAHRYFFKLYALDTELELKAGASKADLEDAMKGHILGQTQIVGLYKR